MTTTPERTATLTTLVAAEVRAWMGRLNVRQSELARRMGETDQWLSMRLKGRTPIDLNELQRIADALGVNVIELLPQRGGQLNVHSVGPRPDVVPASPRPVTPRPASRPISPTRRDSTRPGSPVPLGQRRPGPTRPGERLVAA